MRASLLLVAVPTTLLAQALPLKRAPRPTTTAITAEDLMSRLYVFADDSMQGRETGTRGHLISTDYIARELKRMGLEPAGDSGSFFQNVPLVNRPFDVANSALSVDGTVFVPGVDFVPQSFRGVPRDFDGAQVIFAGQLGDSAMPAADQLRGKAVLVTAPAGGGRGFGGPGGFGGGAALRDAAVILRVASAAQITNGLRAATWPTANMLAPFQPATPSALTILVSDTAAERLLGMPLAQATPGTTGKVVHARIAFSQAPAPARNVVAIVRGSDAKLRNTFVALGAHTDHVGLLQGPPVDHDSLHAYNEARFAVVGMVSRGQRPTDAQRARVDAIHVNMDSLHATHAARMDSIRNGADDDGSGSVTLLEIAEAFAGAKAKPRRSLLFVWHTGEEKGLLGSRWFSDHPTVPRDSIVAQLNMDMVGRGEARDIPPGGPAYLQLVGSKRLSSELGALVEAVNRGEPKPFAFDYSFDAAGHPENIYCRSDHYNYARWGIPVTFFTTGLHGDYHQVSDEPQYIAYDHMARVGRLVHDVAARVANMDKRVVVDGPKPDPTGACRQ